jgi:hypothetical protein
MMIFIATLLGSSAWACPLCHTGTGQQVREGIAASDFFFNFLAVILPFPVLAGIVVLVYFVPFKRPIHLTRRVQNHEDGS